MRRWARWPARFPDIPDARICFGFPRAFLPVCFRAENTSIPTRATIYGISRNTRDLLEASQISVYPIDIRGLKNTTLQPAGGGPELDPTDRQHAGRIGSRRLMMRDVAGQTGGRAFY